MYTRRVVDPLTYGGCSTSGKVLLTLSKFISLHRIADHVGLKLVRLITLTAPFSLFPAAFNNFSIIKLVNRKCPMWFVAKCISIQSSLNSLSGNIMTPALLIMISIVGTSVLNLAVQKLAHISDRGKCCNIPPLTMTELLSLPHGQIADVTSRVLGQYTSHLGSCV